MEKSKRVKPFRCGEFDEFIEKAEAALGLPPKKREKYARREDAILHALELEKQLLGDKSDNFGSPIEGCSNKASDKVKKESDIYSESSDYENIEKSVNLKHGSKKLVVFTEDKDNFDYHIPFSELIYESSVIPGIKSSFEKKRKSSDNAFPNESLSKRRERCSTLVQVLQKSENLPCNSSLQLQEEENIELKSHSNDCYDDDQLPSPNQLAMSPSHVNEDSASESTESTETDSSKTYSINTDEDGFAEPASIPEVELESLEISGQVRHGSTSRMVLEDNDMSHFYSHDPLSPSLGVSKWQSKGKRNNRSLSKRSTIATDLWVARGSMYTANLEEIESDGFEEFDVIERNFRTQKRPCKGYDVSPNLIDWEDLDPTPGGDRFTGKMKSVLVDVDLKVQRSYQREHVPMISLMSKLNGRAIVGHPIQVQILEYGFTDSLLEKLEENIGNSQNRNHKKTPFRKPSVARKGISRGKFPKKLSKKTRNMFANGSNFGNESINSFRGGGLIKATVACIPLKLVFCRLNEELVDRFKKS